MKRVQTPGVRVREKSECGNLQSRRRRSLLVGIHQTALHRGHEHFELGRRRRGVQPHHVSLRLRFKTRRGREERAAHFEIHHRFIHAERQILAQLKVDHRCELADIIEHRQRQRPQHDLGARHAHDHLSRFDLQPAQCARNGGAEHVRVGDVSVRRQLQRSRRDAIDGDASAGTRRLRDAQRLAFHHERGRLTGCARTAAPGEQRR